MGLAGSDMRVVGLAGSDMHVVGLAGSDRHGVGLAGNNMHGVELACMGRDEALAGSDILLRPCSLVAAKLCMHAACH